MISNLAPVFFIIIFSINYIIKEKYVNFFSLNSLLLLLIIFFFLTIIFINKKIKNKISLISCSLYLTFFVINFMVKIFFFETQIEIIKDYKKRNINLRPAVFPALFFDEKINILSGLSNQNTIYCKEADYFTIYFSDRHGFNNDDSVYDKNDKVLLIGDSYTHGACVKEGEDIAGKLRKKGINAINLGMGGNSEITKLATFKEYGQYLNPTKVLWMYTIGDLKGALGELENENIKKYYFDDNYTQNLINLNDKKNKFIDEYLSPLEKKESLDYFFGHFTFYDLRKFIKSIIIENFKISKFFKNIIGLDNERKVAEIQWYDINESYRDLYSEKNLQIVFNTLTKINNICLKNKCELIFVFLPTRQDLLRQKKSFLFKKDLFEIADQLGIRYIDIEKEFLKVDNIDDYMISHYNDNGYSIISDEIFKEINN